VRELKAEGLKLKARKSGKAFGLMPSANAVNKINKSFRLCAFGFKLNKK
jgi:hypothetical protein